MELRYLDESWCTKLREAETRWKKICEKAQKSVGRFSVVVIGQQNNGKSTLCNALVQDWTNQRFRVADVRTTVDFQEYYDSVSNITYVDTPGFGTYELNDASKARDEWFRANLLILVHSVRRGELDDNEVKTLKQLKEFMPQLEQRLFVACSKFGEEDRDSGIEVCNRVKTQISQIISNSIPVEHIDSLFYQQGKSENDNNLVKFSNINILLQWISKHKNVVQPQMEIFEKEREKYTLFLKTIQNIQRLGIDNHKNTKNTYQSSLSVCWGGKRDQIKNSWDNCALYTSDALYCTECGTRLEKDARFCTECGTRIDYE